MGPFKPAEKYLDEYKKPARYGGYLEAIPLIQQGLGATHSAGAFGKIGDKVFQTFRPEAYERNRLGSLPPEQAQQRREQTLENRSFEENYPVIDAQKSKELEQARGLRQATQPEITTVNNRSTVRVPGAIGESNFDTNDARSARFEQSARLGTYAPRALAPEEQMRRNMIATQAGISPDYVPVAERVNEINRQTRAVRDLRASNMGLNPELFDLAGGDASQARRYQRAMEAAIARGAPVMGGPGGGGRGGGLGQAYGDAWEAAAKAKTPESLLSKKGAEFLNAGTDPTQPQTQAAMNIMAGMGREPTAPESIALANQMAALNRGFVQQGHPLAASPGMVSSLESAEGAWYNPMNWFRDATYYKGKTRSGKPFETGYGYNPYLEEAALGFRPPR